MCIHTFAASCLNAYRIFLETYLRPPAVGCVSSSLELVSCSCEEHRIKVGTIVFIE